MPPILISFVYLLVVVLLAFLFWWGFTKIAAAFSAPAQVVTVAQVLFVIILCVIIASWLLSLIGVGRWFSLPGL